MRVQAFVVWVYGAVFHSFGKGFRICVLAVRFLGFVSWVKGFEVNVLCAGFGVLLMAFGRGFRSLWAPHWQPGSSGISP